MSECCLAFPILPRSTARWRHFGKRGHPTVLFFLNFALFYLSYCPEGTSCWFCSVWLQSGGPFFTVLTNHLIINYSGWLALSYSIVHELALQSSSLQASSPDAAEFSAHFQWCAWSAYNSWLSWDFCGINSMTPLWNDKRCQSCYPLLKWSPRVPLLPDEQQLGLQV